MTHNNHKHKKRLVSIISMNMMLTSALLGIIIGTVIFDCIFLYQRSLSHVVVTKATNIQHAIGPKEIVHGDRSKKQVIFTFDAGGGVQSGDKVLSVLAKHHVKGTFFMTGKFVEANPLFVRKVADAGNEIFNHTYDHPHLPTLTNAEIVSELDKMNAILASTTPSVSEGISTDLSAKPFFRPPYGDRDARVIETAYKNGYEDVYWTVDAGDWEQPTGMTATEVEDKILSNLASGNIFLMHIGDDITGQVLDQVFTAIENKGYKIVSLTQGL